MFDAHRIVQRVHGFVAAVCGDPVFRRRLRYQPALALADHGLSGELAPAQLPVRHYEVEAQFDLWGPSAPDGDLRPRPQLDVALLFGLPFQPAPVTPPLTAVLVSLGLKPLALVHGGEHELTRLGAWAASRSLVALLSPEELCSAPDEGKGGYMNLVHGRRPARAGSGAMRGLVIGLDENQAILGWLSLLFQWDDFLGRLLGYPTCCTAAFVERWDRAVAEHQGDPSVLGLAASRRGPFDWRLNVFGRYFGASLIEHFPCTFRCEASLAIARRHEAGLRLFAAEQAEAIQAVLDAPVLYTERHGVFSFPGGRLEQHEDTQALSYAPERMRSTVSGTPLHEALSRRGRIEARGGQIALGPGGSFEGWLVGFSEERLES